MKRVILALTITIGLGGLQLAAQEAQQKEQTPEAEARARLEQALKEREAQVSKLASELGAIRLERERAQAESQRQRAEREALRARAQELEARVRELEQEPRGREGEAERPDRPDDREVLGRRREARRRLQELAGQIERLQQAGKRDEAERLRQEAEEFEQRLHREFGRRDVPPEGPPGRRPPEAMRHLHHLRVAAEHLEAAGRVDDAQRLRHEAERLQQELPPPPERERPGPERQELLGAIGELRADVQRLREEVTRLRQMLEAQGKKPPEVSQDVIYEENVQYATGGGEPLHLDIARPRGGHGPFPGVVCIHGGGWRGGDKAFYRDFIKELAQKRYVAATVQYRFAPQHPFPAQVEDVKAAVRWLRAHAKELKLDPERIGATGGSAGGHLALMLGTMNESDGLTGDGNSGHSSRVQAVVNFFGPTDLTLDYPKEVHGILVDLLGGPREEKLEVYKRASPLTYLTADDPPILTFHGTADNIVPYEQATVLLEAMKKLGVGGRLETLEGDGHGWGGDKLRRTLDETIAFFDEHLKGKK